MSRAEPVSNVRSTQKERQRSDIAVRVQAWLATDWAAIILLCGLTALVAWYKSSFDMWLARGDNLQYYMPYYNFLGQQLRELNIPGWNPYQFSGTTLAADPQSGWMQFPVMAATVFLDPVPAFKALMTWNVALGVLSTYAFARILGMGKPASLVGAISFGFISLIQFNTACCTIYGNLAPWIPLALLGIELATRTHKRIYLLTGICMAGLALCQMISAWIGQGSYYALIITGSYVLYRTVISPHGEGWTLKRRLLSLLVTGSAVFMSGFALAAASLLPRLDINRYTNLSGGDYDTLGAASGNGWSPPLMFVRLLDPEWTSRRLYIGTVVVMLAVLAPVIARRRYAVPYFTGLTIICLILTLDRTPVHQLFYLLPRFRVLHAHNVSRILGVLYIGPSMLAAASVETLTTMRVRIRTLAIGLIPLLFYAGIELYIRTDNRALPRYVWIWVGLVTLLLVTFLLLRMNRDWRLLKSLRPLIVVLPFVFAFLILIDPLGTEFVESVRGHSNYLVYNSVLNSQSDLEARVRTYTDSEDKQGAGAFLAQARDDQGAPVRYFGYDPAGLRTDDMNGTSYQGQVESPVMRALLVGSRATTIGLQDIQGYNPIQIKRYVDLIQRINGVTLNYHDAWILPSGINSPLLSLLSVDYIIVPSTIPPTDSRPDLSYLRQTYKTVFNNQTVRVLAVPNALPRAWVVHDVRQMPKEEILDALASGSVDPRQTAIVETTAPSLDSVVPNGADNVHFTAYGANSMAMDVNAASDGMLVLSEIYIPGWNAYVDGKKTDVYATDYALRGIALTAGNHHVELRYEPSSLRIGVLISAIASLAAVIVFAFALWTFWRDRRRNRLETGAPS
jgi:Bacterial membrane protein YfhO